MVLKIIFMTFALEVYVVMQNCSGLRVRAEYGAQFTVTNIYDQRVNEHKISELTNKLHTYGWL
jgi:hypothetical protein